MYFYITLSYTVNWGLYICSTSGDGEQGWEYTANLFAVPAQFEIFGKRDLFNYSVKKMQLSEADRLSFAFLESLKV